MDNVFKHHEGLPLHSDSDIINKSKSFVIDNNDSVVIKMSSADVSLSKSHISNNALTHSNAEPNKDVDGLIENVTDVTDNRRENKEETKKISFNVNDLQCIPLNSENYNETNDEMSMFIENIINDIDNKCVSYEMSQKCDEFNEEMLTYNENIKDEGDMMEYLVNDNFINIHDVPATFKENVNYTDMECTVNDNTDTIHIIHEKQAIIENIKDETYNENVNDNLDNILHNINEVEVTFEENMDEIDIECTFNTNIENNDIINDEISTLKVWDNFSNTDSIINYNQSAIDAIGDLTKNYSTDEDDYDSSDFQFIHEEEAKIDLLFKVNAKPNETSNDPRPGPSGLRQHRQNGPQSRYHWRYHAKQRPKINCNYRENRFIPEANEFCNLFDGNNSPFVNHSYTSVLESKSVGQRGFSSKVMNVDWAHLQFEPTVPRTHEEDMKAAEETIKIILAMYPNENRNYKS